MLIPGIHNSWLKYRWSKKPSLILGSAMLLFLCRAPQDHISVGLLRQQQSFSYYHTLINYCHIPYARQDGLFLLLQHVS
ncbi:hypothetical protein BJ912DRAFT_969293 [Pholiota molesta]|nr:hypothetical protein BJ912DRAFT_969293 [Pholiota molesta]